MASHSLAGTLWQQEAMIQSYIFLDVLVCIDNLGDALSLIRTCRRLYHKGLRYILSLLPIKISSHRQANSLHRLLTQPYARPEALRVLELTLHRQPCACDEDDLHSVVPSLLIPIIGQASNLRSFKIIPCQCIKYGWIKRWENPVLGVLSNCVHLKSLHVQALENWQQEMDALSRCRLPSLQFVHAITEGRRSEEEYSILYCGLSPFRSTITKLIINWDALIPLSDDDFQADDFPDCVYYSVNELEVLGKLFNPLAFPMGTFPNVRILTLRTDFSALFWADAPAGMDNSLGPWGYSWRASACAHYMLSQSRWKSLDVVTSDLMTLYVFALPCRIRHLNITIEEAGELSVDYLSPVLQVAKPAELVLTLRSPRSDLRIFHCDFLNTIFKLTQTFLVKLCLECVIPHPLQLIPALTFGLVRKRLPLCCTIRLAYVRRVTQCSPFYAPGPLLTMSVLTEICVDIHDTSEGALPYLGWVMRESVPVHTLPSASLEVAARLIETTTPVECRPKLSRVTLSAYSSCYVHNIVLDA